MTPAGQLRAFIAKFSPANQRLIRGARACLRRWLPGANQLIYDNYNFLVIAYCPTERVSDSYFSLGTDKHGPNLFFGYNGTRIDDPKGLLRGTGASNRYLRLPSTDALADPDVRALIDAAIAVSKPAVNRRGKLIVRSVSPNQRPRR